MSTTADSRPLRVREAARELGLSVATVRRRIADGTLPATRFGGVVLVPAAAIRALAQGVA